jgi:anti-sigma B factor antagonist
VELGLNTRTEGRYTVIAVAGELDVFTAPKLEEELSSQIEQGQSQLVVDLSGVTFLDSTGLGTMVKALKWVREKGGSLQVVAAEERIVKVFRITGLDSVMALQPALTDALDS